LPCPPELSPAGSRVNGSPPPPSSFGARDTWTSGSFPARLPGVPWKHRALPWASVPPQGFRPIAPAGPRAGSSHEVSPPTTTSRPQVRFTRACLTRHLPASWFRPPRRLPPCGRCRPGGRLPPMGFTTRGSYLPVSRTRYRAGALLPFPVLPAFSSEDEKVGSSAAAPGP
jgi:hypothetical protein